MSSNLQPKHLSPPRWSQRKTEIALATRLQLVLYENSQDFALEVADAERLQEFVSLYESGILDREAQFALMELIVASLDDDSSYPPASLDEQTHISCRIEMLLRRDFLLHLHTINYWRCADEEINPDPDLPDNHYAVSPMMRRIWHDSFRSEHACYLDETDVGLSQEV